MKNQKGYGAVELLLIVLFVGAVIGTGVVVARKHGTSKSDINTATTKPVTSVAPASTLMPSDVTDRVKTYLATKYTLLDLDKNNQPKQGEASVRVSGRTPAYKADGYNFYVTYQGGSTLDAMPGPVDWANATLPRPVDTALRQKVIDTYTSLGLTKTGTRGGDSTEVYQGKGLICTVEAPSSQTSSNSASCGQLSKYVAAAEQAKPFVAVLPNATTTTVLSGLTITDSKVSGYQKATAGIGDMEGDGGAATLFYRKTNGAWQYFAATQMQLDCSMYKTVDQKAAFSGDACADGDSQSTVH